MNSPVSLPLPPSLYADTAVAPTPTPPLDADKKVSVAIIGGGFTGLSTALHLAEQGVDVTVLEAQQPGWGASGNNGGQVNPLAVKMAQGRMLIGALLKKFQDARLQIDNLVAKAPLETKVADNATDLRQAKTK